ncbi:putative pal1-like protein [Rosellinia necatrix]|uniref:Putative pal1-like protein n=1 Tax=Rosellinia necatrix TaxID=77044 RepID=A0A1S7UN73_ROSNE|nr:putative pal1-like protein [Rosellinia necatrix]
MSGSTSALAQLKPFTLNSRSLFIKCIPAPRSFYERRAVLAALQKSSQQSIEMFKKLQDSSSFIAITTRPEAAVDLIDNSPLERTIVSQSPSSDEISSQSSWSSNLNTSGPIANPVNPIIADSTAKATPASDELGLSYRTFTLHIFPTNPDYDHREEVRKSPLHGQWPGDGKKMETFISSALKTVIPSGAMAPALRDWETGNQLARDLDSFADNGPEGAASMLLGRKRTSTGESFLLERIRRRAAEQETPKVMSSLVQFFKECRSKSATTPEPGPSQSASAEDSQT